MSARTSAASAPLFYDADAPKEKQGEFKNWSKKSIVWAIGYPVTFSGAKNVAKSIRAISSYFLLWFTSSFEAKGESGRRTLASAKVINSFSKNAKNLIAFFSIPELTVKAVNAIRESLSTILGRRALGMAPSVKKAKAQTVFKAVMSTNEILAPVCDSITMGNDLKVLGLGSTAMKAVSGVNNGSLLVASAVQTPKSIINIWNNLPREGKVDAKTAQGQRKEVLVNLADLAKWISYLALSIIGLIGLIVMGIPGWIGLTMATSALFFSIVGAYCKDVLSGPKQAPRGWLPVAMD